MQEQALLDYINRYVSLTLKEQTLLLSKVVHRRLLKGQYLVQQGDVCRHESFVLSGCLKTFYVDEQGQEHTL